MTNAGTTRLDDFKASVARQSSIPAQCIIALTPQGRPLKLQTIQTEVSDRSYLTHLATQTVAKKRAYRKGTERNICLRQPTYTGNFAREHAPAKVRDPAAKAV